MISCITPYDRLEVHFKFHSDRIRTIAQLHDLSIPGRISEGQLDTALQGDFFTRVEGGLGNYTVLNREGRHIATQLNAASRGTSRTELQAGLGEAAMLDQMDRASEGLKRYERAQSGREHDDQINQRGPTFYEGEHSVNEWSP